MQKEKSNVKLPNSIVTPGTAMLQERSCSLMLWEMICLALFKEAALKNIHAKPTAVQVISHATRPGIFVKYFFKLS